MLERRILLNNIDTSNLQAVDLGLSVKWAQANIVKNSDGTYKVGDNETDYGCYFSWGNVIGHNEGEGYNFNSSTYNGTPGKSLTANIAVGETYDAARKCLGTPWRMPTKEEFQELYDNTDREWVTNHNGVSGCNGWKFMKKSDHSVYVFFPAAGYYNGTSLYNRGSGGDYWSSSYYDSSYARNLWFNSGDVDPQGGSSRYCGFPVRAVQD